MSKITEKTFTLRWGIIGTGLIASWFVSDLVLDPSTHRNEHSIKHLITAIGSSSLEKGTAFSEKHIPKKSPFPSSSVLAEGSPRIYDTYEGVYNDPNVDVVYIATPHALHARNALDAIKAGKHVLCEKPMTVNAAEAEKVIAAAEARGVFLMEAVWTRFFPLSLHLQKLLHTTRTIGRLTRLTVDFGLDRPLESLPPSSRTADKSLGAGALLDIGIYSLTWAAMILFSDPTNNEEEPDASSSLVLGKKTGVDEMCAVILRHEASGTQAICTASYNYKSDPVFARIEGTEGTITIEGRATSKPSALVIRRKNQEEERVEFKFEGWGFFYEADAVARDIQAGRMQNALMPWKETARMMKLMDRVRWENGLRYPMDGEEE